MTQARNGAVVANPAVPLGPEPLLDVDDVSCVLGGVRALSEVTMHIAPGELVGIIGPNGAGKTTLFNVVTGFVAATSGEVRWGGAPLRGGRAHRVARSGLVRTFQNVGGFTGLTVAENLELATRGRDGAAVRRVEDLLHLADVRDTLVEDCSLATRKLVGIAMALVRTPRLLLLDEPLAGLDDTDRDRVTSLIEQVHDSGVTVCMVEHDIGRTLRLADRIVVLDAGRLVATGTPADLARDDVLARNYLSS
ncbi:ABC transporter ATP-binding protein [Pseudonocardia dioxanivorans]|uniref:ABC transporter ATP-binding protein n=1 Tax=Pseudonocardia dioxanivorans TaxID=240495 RepID=UPI000CD0293D|nr:ATP-binding cassette domain-containing protein [Pseudonocardia dioxanivorans]